jgi:predicted S18 family serine protease
MKRPSVVIAVAGLIGLVLGVAGGLSTAASSSCEADFVPEGGTCYWYFGRYFSDTTYYAVSVGLWGLGIGLALGLFIITRGWLLRRRG